MFKRKIYDKLLQWKQDSDGHTALLIEGARRIGKSTIVEEFAKNEYDSYILIDFSMVPQSIRDLFNDVSELNYLFLQLQLQFRVDLIERKSLIIFDEVQFCPRARQAIKHLVKDHRYDYIETGSLISIQKNVKDILIPSEERRIQMYPMDYEEFLWALGDSSTYTHNYEIDFLLSRKNKICPIEVKSSRYKSHASLDAFIKKFSGRLLWKYMVYTKDYAKDGEIICLPAYMVPFV